MKNHLSLNVVVDFIITIIVIIIINHVVDC